jgi:hypothetical protein
MRDADKALTAQATTTLPRRLSLLVLCLIVAVTAAGCAAIGGIFKAGVWVGVIVAALLVVVVLFVVRSISS